MTARLRNEDGFTLVELLVATMVGTIVVLASFGLVDMAIDGQATTENRIDASSRGRTAMEQVVRQLRSQACFGRTAPIIEGRDDKVVFYASLAPSPANAGSDPTVLQQRTLEFVPEGAAGRGYLRETVVTGNATPPPDTQFTGTPTTRRIVDNISRVPGTPVFRFYRFDPVNAPQMLQLAPDATGQIVADDRRLTVQVRATFDTWSAGGLGADRVRTRLDSRVVNRNSTPTDPTRSPVCT